MSLTDVFVEPGTRAAAALTATGPVAADLDRSTGPLARSVSANLTVPLANGERARYVNLDVAASAPCLDAVRTVVDGAQEWYSSVHRGAGLASAVSTEALAESRRIVGEFVGARGDDVVVFTRNTTDALNLLASVLPPHTTVVTFASEHHANLLAWRRVDPVVLPVPAHAIDAVRQLDSALESLRSVSSDAADTPLLVAVTGASNVTGEVWPVEELAQVAHRHGARIVVDAAQLAPHRRIDIAATSIDYVALSGHKLYAPYGTGVLIGRSDWLDAGAPYLAGGGAVRLVTADRVEWTSGPARHEAGTPNVLGAVALAAACLELQRIGHAALHQWETALTNRLRRGLRRVPGLEIYTTWGPSDDRDQGDRRGDADIGATCDPATDAVDRIGVIVCNLDGWHHGLLAAVLSAEYGIGVRDGAFCAHRLVAEIVGDRCEAVRSDPNAHAGAVRISVGATTSFADVERLVHALRSIAQRGASFDYELRDGRYVLADDRRRTPDLFAAVR